MLSVFDHLKQNSVIMRCAGGGLSGGGQNQTFTSSSHGWTTLNNGSTTTSTTGTVNGSAALTSSGAWTSERNTFLYDGATDNGGVYISFDFYEMDSWDDEEFFVNIGYTNFDLGNFQVNRESDQLAAKGSDYFERAHWKKGVSSDDQHLGGSSTWKDQKHTYEFFLSDEFLQYNTDPFGDSETLEITFSSFLNQGTNDESWAIDNFEIREATVNDRREFFVEDSNTTLSSINNAFDNLSMTATYAATTVPNLWNLFQSELGVNGFEGTVNTLDSLIGGKLFDDISTSDLESMARNASESFETWFTAGNGYDEGFDYWGNLLWDAMENQIAPQISFWDTLGTVSAFVAATAAAATVPAFISGATGFGNTVITAIVNDQGTTFEPVPDTVSGFGFIEGLNTLYEELLDRGVPTATTEANRLKDAVEGAYEAYYDFVGNAQLLAHLSSFNNGPDINGVSITDYDDLRDLGFTVNTQSLVNNPPFGLGATRSTKVTITDGDTELFTDKIEYWFISGGDDPYRWEFT